VLRSLIAIASGVLLGVLLTGCALSGELPPEVTSLTSPDGRTDLVLTWRGGGGAAGWTEEHIALVRHGRSAEDSDDLATLDPNTMLGARWLSNGAAEIGLDGGGDLYSGSLPTTAWVGDRVITLRVRDFRRCSPAAIKALPPHDGLAILLRAWDCGGGVGRLTLSAFGSGFQFHLADEAVRWPTPLLPTVKGNAIDIPAHRAYPDGAPAELVGDGYGGRYRVSWAS